MTPSDPLPDVATFGELLLARAERDGDRMHLRLLDDHGRETLVGYAALAAEAMRVAAALVRAGVRPGDRVAIMLTTGLPLITAIYGAHIAGAVPVPLYPPFRLRDAGNYLDRLAHALAAATPTLLVVDAPLHPLLRAGLGVACPRLATPGALVLGVDRPISPVRPNPDRPALVQFSSGSTGPQKGVVLTHRQILANARAIAQRLDLRSGMRGCSWLPLYHDMGLIGGLFIPLLVGIEGTLFSPRAFLLDPAHWLRVIDRYRSQLTIGPNFAYSLVMRRCDPLALAQLDLSCMRIALNGAEPVSPALARAFEERFAPLGWRPGTLLGVYGLAEVALGATMPEPGAGVRGDRIDPARLRAEGVALPSDAEDAREVAAVGPPLPGYAIAVRAPSGEMLAERCEGEVWVSGPSAMQGYLADPAATAAVLRNGWVATGDLGYHVGGRLFITGRLKDLVVRGGRNYHPQELEQACEAVPGVRTGSAVAFGIEDPARGTEKVVVAFETRTPAKGHAALARAVVLAVAAATGLAPDEALPLPPGTVPKTTSGKRQRRAARDLYLDGLLGKPIGALDAIKAAVRVRRAARSAGSVG